MHTIIYFSPTGNVEHLAKKLASELKISSSEVHALEFTDPSQLEKNVHLVLLYPVHAFNAPRIVKRFVNSLPPEKFKYISLIAAGCSDNWINKAVPLDLSRSLRKKGYTILLEEILAMPLTFIMNFPMDLNRRLIAESEQKITDICRHITEKVSSNNTVPFKSHLMNFIGKVESPAARIFGLELHSNKNCTSCGICWNNCPEKNIKEKRNGRPGFGFSCCMCMRCIYSCPEKAISPRISKFIPIKGGYALSRYLNQ